MKNVILIASMLFAVSSFGQINMLSKNNIWKEVYWHNGILGFTCDFPHTLQIGDVAQKNGLEVFPNNICPCETSLADTKSGSVIISPNPVKTN